MRCSACGAELILTTVVPDDTARVRGCEHHTFICSGCQVTNRRLVVTRHGREDESVPMHMEAAPLVVPALSVHEESVATPGLLDRVVARLRGH
jgi:hypothetical protein